MLIDCDTCAVRGDACSECVIGVLLRRPPVGTPVDLDADEAAAFGSLAGAGMVPPLRLVPLLSEAGVRDAAGPDPTERAAGGTDTPDKSRQSDIRPPRRAPGDPRRPQQTRRCAGYA
jgi:hypothetical protein